MVDTSGAAGVHILATNVAIALHYCNLIAC